MFSTFKIFPGIITEFINQNRGQQKTDKISKSGPSQCLLLFNMILEKKM